MRGSGKAGNERYLTNRAVNRRKYLKMRSVSRLAIALGVMLGFVGCALGASPGGGKTLVLGSIEAMGGTEQLRDLHALKLKGIGHRYMLEQSERPEGLWLLDYFQISEERDLDHGRIRRETKSRGCDSTECWKSAEWSTSTLIVADHIAAMLREKRCLPHEQAFCRQPRSLSHSRRIARCSRPSRPPPPPRP